MMNRVYPPERGATGRMMRDLALALEKSGWTVSVLSCAPQHQKTQKTKSLTIYKIKESKNSKTALGCLANLWRLKKAAKKLPRHDVVLTMTDPPFLGLIGVAIAKSKKSTHVHWVQDLYPDLFPPLGVKLPDWLYKNLHTRCVRAMNKSGQVVTIGRCMSKYIKRHGVMANKVTTIPNWADFEVVAPSGKTPESFSNLTSAGAAKKPEEMFRDDSPKFRVLYAGTVGLAHPMQAVIEAAEILKGHKEIEFVWVGDAACQKRLSEERSRRGLENMKFLPYQPIEKLRDVMESGDVHLVTMRQSVKGMMVPCKFYSGLTVGRPTIFVGPQNTEIGVVLEEHKAGVVIDPMNPKALADAIYAYRTNGDLWFESQEGALKAASLYHPNKSLQQWVTMLEKFSVLKR